MSAPEAMVHGTVVAACLLTAWTILDGSLFAWHPVLMVLGFLGFLSEASMAAIGFRSLEGQQRVAAIWRHAVMALCGCLTIAAAFAAIFTNKVR